MSVGVSFCAVSSSLCPPFGKELLIQLTVLFSLYVILVISNLGFSCETLVLFAPVPGHNLPFYFSNGIDSNEN